MRTKSLILVLNFGFAIIVSATNYPICSLYIFGSSLQKVTVYIFWYLSSTDFPSKGPSIPKELNLSKHNSYKIHPKPHISVLIVDFLPEICSGDK